MPTHKTEDYKLSAVKYYLKNDFSMKYVCDIFECKKQSLSRWVNRYLLENSIKDIIENLFHVKSKKNILNYLYSL